MEVVDILKRADLEKFLAQHKEVNFLQSAEWGDVHKALGDVVVRGGLKKNGALVAVWVGVVKNAKRGRYLEVSGGPVLDWSDESIVGRALEQLKRIAKQNGCVFVRFRPSILDSTARRDLLYRCHARKAPMHLHAEHTHIIDLTADEEALLANMRRQTRYEVRRVPKRGLTISARVPTKADIDEFYQLQKDTATRHGFVTSSREFLQALRLAFGESLEIYRAEKNGRLLNLALIISWGEEADYFEAASAAEARREPGAYGIIWNVMQHMKKRGVKRLNLWGIAYNENPKHRYAGVTTFKRGFGGDDVIYCPAHDIVVKRIRYLLNLFVEVVRRKKRGL